MKKSGIFIALFLTHLTLTYLLGLSSALSLGGNPTWIKVTTWIFKFPLLTFANYILSTDWNKGDSAIWSDPFFYLIGANSLLWAVFFYLLCSKFLMHNKSSETFDD